MTRALGRKNCALASFIALASYAALLLSTLACSQHKKQEPVAVKEKELAAPRITLLSQLTESDKPRLILLDTVPKPSIINVNLGNRAMRPGVKTGNVKNAEK